MSGWSIDPAGVVTVLGAVEGARDELVTAIDGIIPAHETLLAGADVLGLVPAEVQALLEEQSANMTSIGNRIAAGTLGAYNATASYVQHDEIMAANTQAAAVAAATSGDLSFFGES